MNPFGWKKWIELPHRGEPKQKYPKRRRQKRDLILERKENLKSILFVFTIFALAFICIILDSSISGTNKIVTGIFGFLFASIFTIAIFKGIVSINKFRRGYDIDISDSSEKNEDTKSKDSTD